jgi:hypothetical protein
METLTRLFGSLLLFVYRCFDRIVINGYLSGLSRPEQVVHFVRAGIDLPVVSKEVLSQRTNDIRTGWSPTPAIKRYRLNGLGSAFAKRIASCLRISSSWIDANIRHKQCYSNQFLPASNVFEIFRIDYFWVFHMND